ncbi:MAG TPA: hypothetical protein VM754_11615, partial [Actinomycetota bacterium]|nr:hypothetical protein [Actinomycetota bacterium]
PQEWGEDAWHRDQPAGGGQTLRPSPQDEAWARANPQDAIDEDWKPLSVHLGMDEHSMPDPITEAAARLRAAKEAIKVENGLAYVLVDDEGRPVLR